MASPRIHQIQVGPLQVYAYVVVCPKTGDAVLVDPAAEPDRITAVIDRHNAHVRWVLITHGHHDHVPSQCPWDAPVCVHRQDVGRVSRTLAVDRTLEDGDVLPFGSCRAHVLSTPGHTPGAVCYRVGDDLFTGDTLFVGAVGRTDLPGGSQDALLSSIERRILPLPGHTRIWPGHGYGGHKGSTVARERAENPYITDFILDAD